MKKKILYVITKSNWGGAQRYVYDLATNLSGDFDAVVACGPSEIDTATSLVSKLQDAHIRTIVVPALARDVGAHDMAAFIALLRLFRKEKPDIVHLNSSKVGALGALAARIARVPRIIFTCHGWAFREARNPISKVFIWLASIATIIFSHKIICVSDYDKRSFYRAFTRSFIVIKNAVADIQFLTREKARHAIAAKLPHAITKKSSEKRLWIVTVAELTANKNISLALQSLAVTRDAGIEFLYVIMGDGQLRQQLQEEIARLNLTDHVYIAGFYEEAATYLKAFDLFLMPSLKEGLPYSILEARSADVAVLASKVGGIPEIVGTSDTVCPVNDTECFAHAIEKYAAETTMTDHRNLPDFKEMIRQTANLYRV